MKKIISFFLILVILSTIAHAQYETTYSEYAEMTLSGNGEVLAVTGRIFLDSNLAEGGVYPIDFFDSQTGELIKSIDDIIPRAKGIGLNYNGTLFSYSTIFGNADVIDIQTEERVMVLQTGGAAEAGPTNWSRGNNNLVATFGIGISRVFDVALHEVLFTGQIFSLNLGQTLRVELSNDGTLLAQSISGETIAYLVVWDTTSSSGQPITIAENMGGRSISWHPNSEFVASNTRGGINILTISSNQVSKLYLTNPDEVIISVAWSPDGTKIAGGSRNNMVWIWDVATAQIIGNYPTEFAVTSVAWSPDSQRLYHTGGSAGAYINGLPMADYIAQENSALPKQFTRYIWAIALRAVTLFRLPTV
jgi:WD40 repeat protein